MMTAVCFEGCRGYAVGLMMGRDGRWRTFIIRIILAHSDSGRRAFVVDEVSVSLRTLLAGGLKV